MKTSEGEQIGGPRIVGVKAHACEFGLTFAPVYEDALLAERDHKADRRDEQCDDHDEDR